MLLEETKKLDSLLHLQLVNKRITKLFTPDCSRLHPGGNKMADESMLKATGQSTESLDEASIDYVQRKQCEDNANAYIKNCKRFEIQIDPNVVAALLTGWRVMQPTKDKFKEGGLLPLMGLLDDNQHVRKLNLASSGMNDPRYRSAGNGDSNARILAQILRNNKSIQDVDLSNTGLNDDGMAEICAALRVNKSVTSLNLSMNHFGEQGAKDLQQALTHNFSLKRLDLSRNALGFRSINSIVCSCASKNLILQTNGNFVFEEILNSVSHGVAFIVSVVASCVLISEAAEQHLTTYHFWACALYSFSLMFLFLSSCLFHSFFMLPTTSRILQILDHVGIYLLIAGSYTPFLMIGLHGSIPATTLLVAEWVFALVGIIFAMCSDLNAPSSTVVELITFLTMGLGLFSVSSEIGLLPAKGLWMLWTGGLAYISGIAFFILGEYKPIYHCVWHCFVVLGAALHWFAIYWYVLPLKI